MAKREGIVFDIALKGFEKAKSALQGVLNVAKETSKEVDKAGDGKAAEERQKEKEKRRKELRQFGGRILADAFGRANQAFQTTAANIFDTGLTATEREISITQAGLAGIPFVGDAFSKILGNVAATQTQTASGTANQIAAIFGPAFRAIGSQNPNATEAELRELITNQLGSQIDTLAERIRPQELAEQVGKRFINDRPSVAPPVDFARLGDEAQAQLDATLKRIEESFGVDTELLRGLVSDELFTQKIDELSESVTGVLKDVEEGITSLGKTIADKVGDVFGTGDPG